MKTLEAEFYVVVKAHISLRDFSIIILHVCTIFTYRVYQLYMIIITLYIVQI